MIEFKNLGERIAWDRYAAGFAVESDMTPADAANCADELLEERRKRSGTLKRAGYDGPERP